MGRRAYFSQILIYKTSWSKRKQAFGPQGAMDTRTLTLTACAWRLLCDMPSAQGSRDRVGTPPETGHCMGRPRFSHRLCMTLEHLFLKRQNPKEKSAEISAKTAEKSAQKSARRKSAQKSAHKSVHKNQHQNRAKDRCEDSVSLENEARKKTKRSVPNLRKPPAPRDCPGISFACRNSHRGFHNVIFTSQKFKTRNSFGTDGKSLSNSDSHPPTPNNFSNVFGFSVSSLVGACHTTRDRISATGSSTVSKCVLRSCTSFCLIAGPTVMA